MRKPGTQSPRKRGERLTTEAWLRESMEMLAKRGPAALTLESLTRHLKVTTGSFYYHFKSHADFLHRLTDKYIEDYTHVVANHIQALSMPPREKLLEASRMIIEQELSAFDTHFRSLAIVYPKLQPKLEAMDSYRTDFIRGLFEDMGYSGNELIMRVHTFVILHSMELGASTCLAPEHRLELLEERIGLLAD